MTSVSEALRQSDLLVGDVTEAWGVYVECYAPNMIYLAFIHFPLGFFVVFVTPRKFFCSMSERVYTNKIELLVP